MKITLEHWITPILFLVGGLVIGLIVEKIILSKLKKLSKRTPWPGDDVLVESLRNFLILWSFLAGAYVAIYASPVSIEQLRIGEKMIVVVTIISLTGFAAKFIAGLVQVYSFRTTALLPSASIVSNLARVFIFLLGMLMVLHSLGISIAPALAALGVGGLAVALALQEPLSNLFSGLQVLATQQIRPGDFVKLESGEEGYIVDITWRNTSIRTPPNNMIIVPNSKLAGMIITNYHLPDNETAVLLEARVSYSTDLKRAEEISIGVAREIMKDVSGGVPEFEPMVRYHTFGDFSINFTLVLPGKHITDQQLLKHECIKRIHERYRAENIEIPFPIRILEMKNNPQSSKT